MRLLYCFFFGDVAGDARRFYAMNDEWGFPEFLSMDTFKDASKGYLVNDCCVFGAEVFVARCTGIWERFSLIENPPLGTYTWKIENFATKEKSFKSETFEVGGNSW